MDSAFLLLLGQGQRESQDVEAFAPPQKNTPAEAGACPWRGTWAQYWALRLTPEKVLYPFTRTCQVPAAGLLMVQVSLLPLRYGRQV